MTLQALMLRKYEMNELRQIIISKLRFVICITFFLNFFPSPIIQLLDIKQLATVCYKNDIWFSGLQKHIDKFVLLMYDENNQSQVINLLLFL